MIDHFAYTLTALRPKTGHWAKVPEGPRGLDFFGQDDNGRLARRPTT